MDVYGRAGHTLLLVDAAADALPSDLEAQGRVGESGIAVPRIGNGSVDMRRGFYRSLMILGTSVHGYVCCKARQNP